MAESKGREKNTQTERNKKVDRDIKERERESMQIWGGNEKKDKEKLR